MSFAAMVFDIDGTLLDSTGRMSQSTLGALRACDEQGILLYLATARPRRLVFRPREAQRDIDFLLQRGVFYNGAVAFDDELDYAGHWAMAASLVSEVTDYLVSAVPQTQITLQYSDEYHSFRLPISDEILTWWGFRRDELLTFDKACRRDCSKIVAWAQGHKMEGAFNGLLERFDGKVNAILSDLGSILMVMDSMATKERALTELLSLRRVAPRDVVVFGDDTPDWGMFNTFGCSVAMANAYDRLKDAATYVTRSNDDDGIVYALTELLEIL